MPRLLWWLAGVVGLVVIYLCVYSVVLLSYKAEDISSFKLKGFDHHFNTTIFTTFSHSSCSPGVGSWGDQKGDLFPVMVGTNCNLYTRNERDLEYETTFNGTSHGSCWGDIDKDGWDDIVLVGKGTDKLYYNRNGSFTYDNALSFLSYFYGDGLSCILIDVNSDGYLDVVRVSTSQNVSFFQFIPSETIFEDVTNSIGLPATVQSFVTIGNLPKPYLALISEQGFLEVYDIRHRPYRNVTYKLASIPRQKLVTAKIFDMDNDRNYDFVLLPIRGPPIVVYNFGNFGFSAYTLPSHTEDSSEEDIPLDLTIADFNNDMFPDIYTARRRKEGSHIFNILYLNKGRSFEALGGSMASLGPGPLSVNSIDFNVDGHVDISMFSSGGIHLFTNAQIAPNNWIQIELAPEGQHSVSGTMVRVRANNVTQMQVVLGAEKRHKRLHFGIGNATVVDEIEIFWFFFAGVSYKFYGIAPNQLITLTLPLAMFEPPPRSFEVIASRAPMQIVCPKGQFRLKPGFLILGIWKAGTTSLAGTLAQHPQVVEASRKEIFYWSKFVENLPPDWYWAQFPCTDSTRLISFEATAGYLFSHEAPSQIKKEIPHAKLIIMLREPVERMYSHFYMSTRESFGGAQKFDEIVRTRIREFHHCAQFLANCSAESEDCIASLTDVGCAGNLLAAGLYYYEIKRWFSFFPREQFKIVHYKDFVGTEAPTVVEDVERFLGLDSLPLSLVAKNISPKREPMWNSTKILLKEFFAPYNKLVYELLEFDYGWDKT